MDKLQLPSSDVGWGQNDLPLPSSAYDWNFNSFMEEYNKLYATLNQLDEVELCRGEVIKQDDEEGSKYKALIQEFVERSRQVATDLPHLKEDILCRVELLTAKWDILQMKDRGIYLRKKRYGFEIGATTAINEAITQALEWMCSIEDNLEPLKFNVKWSEKSMRKKTEEIKIQQEEIDFHGKWIKSLMRKCEDKCEWDAVKDLEERWHKIRLRVLEWQYFLEGLTWTSSSNEVPFIDDSTLTSSKSDLKRGSSNLDCPKISKLSKISNPPSKGQPTSLRNPRTMERCADPSDFETSSPLKAKAASPNCAAYFFKHGHHHPAAVGVSDSHDRPSDAKLPAAAIGSEADVHELVNRADELVLKNAARNCAEDGNKLMDSRDASGEEGSSADEDDGVGRSEENDVGGRMDEESDDSSCSHDMTLTMTSSSTSCGVEDNKSNKELNEAVAMGNAAAIMNKVGEVDAECAPLDSEGEHVEKKACRRLRTRGCKNGRDVRADDKAGDYGSATDISEAELSEYWDQEKYLSEHHYDEQVDEDAALRILNFGDDYRNYIDSLSDGLSSCDDKKRTKKKFRKSKYHYPPNIDSGSDCEVSITGLENIFDVFTTQYEELGAIVSSACNLSSSIEVQNQLEHCVGLCQDGASDLTSAIEGAMKDERIHLGKKDQRKYKILSRRWHRLRLFCKEALIASKSYQELCASVDSLQDVLGVSSETVENSTNDESTLQAVIVKLSGYKSDLFNINLGVHSLIAGRRVLVATAPTNAKEDEATTQEEAKKYGRWQEDSHIRLNDEELSRIRSDERVTTTAYTQSFFEGGYDCLKTAVVRLYAQWDNVLQRANSSLIDLDKLSCRRKDLEEEAGRRFGDVGFLESRGQASRAEGSLYKTQVVQHNLGQITPTDSHNFDETLREVLETPNKDTPEVVSSVNSSSTGRRGCNKKSAGNLVSSKLSIPPPELPFWIRVMYKAAPLQLMLLCLWITSWFVGPTCCDYSNHTNLLTPQLQFFNGPPPI